MCEVTANLHNYLKTYVFHLYGGKHKCGARPQYCKFVVQLDKTKFSKHNIAGERVVH